MQWCCRSTAGGHHLFGVPRLGKVVPRQLVCVPRHIHYHVVVDMKVHLRLTNCPADGHTRPRAAPGLVLDTIHCGSGECFVLDGWVQRCRLQHAAVAAQGLCCSPAAGGPAVATATERCKCVLLLCRTAAFCSGRGAKIHANTRRGLDPCHEGVQLPETSVWRLTWTTSHRPDSHHSTGVTPHPPTVTTTRRAPQLCTHLAGHLWLCGSMACNGSVMLALATN